MRACMSMCIYENHIPDARKNSRCLPGLRRSVGFVRSVDAAIMEKELQDYYRRETAGDDKISGLRV